MKAKTFFISIILGVLSLTVQPIFPAQQGTEKEKKAIELDYKAGLNLVYNHVPVKFSDSEMKNALDYYYLAVQVDADLLDFLTVGVVAGLNSNTLADAFNIEDLPLSLGVDSPRFNSMMFGIRSKAEVYSWNYFTFTPTFELLFFKKFSKEIPIDLSIVSGTAELKNSFTQLGAEFLVQYDGLDDFSIFAGPHINLVNGDFKVSESIQNLTGETSLSYHQEKALGLTAGVFYEWGDHFDVYAKVMLFSQTSISVSLFYVF